MNSNLFDVPYCYTMAGVGSCVHLRSKRVGNVEPVNLLFDIGTIDPLLAPVAHVFVSHSHIDHIGGAVAHARMRSITHPHPATYFVPTAACAALNDARKAFERLDGSKIPMNIVAVSPQEEDIIINKNYFVRVFPTIHRIDSQGYALFRRFPAVTALKAEYRRFSSKEIGEAKRQGEEVFEIVHEPRDECVAAYTGDTTFAALLLPDNAFLLRVPLLFMEVTYLDGDITKAHRWAHVHIDELIQHHHRFRNEQIVLCHLSSRYSLSLSLSILKKKLPPELASRILVSLRSFGATETLTPLHRVNVERIQGQVGHGWGSHGNTKMNQRYRQTILNDNGNSRGNKQFSSDQARGDDSDNYNDEHGGNDDKVDGDVDSEHDKEEGGVSDLHFTKLEDWENEIEVESTERNSHKNKPKRKGR